MQDATNEIMATKIHCGSMKEMSHDKCSHQKYIVDLQLDNDHSHDQVQMWIYVAIYIYIYMYMNYNTPIKTWEER